MPEKSGDHIGTQDLYLFPSTSPVQTLSWVSTFQGGPPRKSFWTGLKQDKESQFEIKTLRCGRCGYLEHYAKG